MSDRTFGEIAREEPEVLPSLNPVRDRLAKECWPEILALYEAAWRLGECDANAAPNECEDAIENVIGARMNLDDKALEVARE